MLNHFFFEEKTITFTLTKGRVPSSSTVKDSSGKTEVKHVPVFRVTGRSLTLSPVQTILTPGQGTDGSDSWKTPTGPEHYTTFLKTFRVLRGNRTKVSHKGPVCPAPRTPETRNPFTEKGKDLPYSLLLSLFESEAGGHPVLPTQCVRRSPGRRSCRPAGSCRRSRVGHPALFLRPEIQVGPSRDGVEPGCTSRCCPYGGRGKLEKTVVAQ